ncbi:MAG: helix-turn-helix domain-containing protein, partial [Myxococcota bacterium]
MSAIQLTDGEIDLVRRVVRRSERTAVLTPTEAALLEVLSRNLGRDVGRDALEAEVTADRGVDRTVHRVRAKIELDPTRPVHLLTVYQVGYRPPAPRAARAARTNLGP